MLQDPRNPFGGFGMGDLDEPKKLALLGLAQGLLKAGQPSPMPVGIGGALGQGIQGALSNYMMGSQIAQQRELMNLRKADAERKSTMPAGYGPGTQLFRPGENAPFYTVPFKPEDQKPPAAPQTRKIRVGNEEVTQEFAVTPETPMGAWREVGRGPAFSDKPAVKIDIGQKGDSKYMEERLAGEAKAIEKLYSSADTAMKSNAALDRVAASNSEAFAGSAAPIMANVAGFLSSFGYDPKSLTSTAKVDQAISEMLATRMSELGARGLTDKDMEVLRNNLPRVDQSRSARLAVVDVLKRANDATITEAQERRRMEIEQYPDLKSRTRKYSWEMYKPSSPKPDAPKYSDEDIKHTAMKYGLSVDEVKKRLGIK